MVFQPSMDDKRGATSSTNSRSIAMKITVIDQSTPAFEVDVWLIWDIYNEPPLPPKPYY